VTAEEFAIKFAAIEKALALRRTIVLGMTVYLTVHSYYWSTTFALQAMKSTPLNEIGAASIGAIIFAVLAPVTWLQKVVLGEYMFGKRIDAMNSESAQLGK